MSDHTQKYLESSTWYHGTTLDAWNNMCQVGIKADYNIGNELDFGYGFYLTPKLEQAVKFITTIIKYKNEETKSLSRLFEGSDLYEVNSLSKIPIIIEFSCSPVDWINAGRYNYTLLNQYNDEFAKFVAHNRLNNAKGEDHHNYDFIFGVMSDSNPVVDILKYRNGEIGYDKLIDSFKKGTSYKQLSIHSQNLCDILKPTRAYIIESGEELNINEYIQK